MKKKLNKKLLNLIALCSGITATLAVGMGGIAYSLQKNNENADKRIALPNSVYKISDDGTTILGFVDDFDPSQYKNCNTMIIPKGITAVSDLVFDGKIPSYIKHLEFSEGLKAIGIQSFANCYFLEDINFPDSLEEIGNNSFMGCGKLTSVNIPENLVNIGQDAFLNCSSIKNINVSSENHKYGLANNLGPKSQVLIEKNNDQAIFSNSSYAIGKLACGEIVLPMEVTSLHNEAFSNCASISSITFNEKFDSVNANAFLNCFSLKKVVLPSTTTKIYDGAFWNCFSLTSINLPEGLTVINQNAFCSCRSLKNISFPESLTKIGDYAFMYTDLDSISIPTNVNTIGFDAFGGCDKVENISISSKNTTFGLATNLGNSKVVVKKADNKFEWTEKNGCVGALALGDIVFPNEITTIPYNAFERCPKITSVRFPDKLTQVGYKSFAFCSSITELDFSNCTSSAISLYAEAFVSCTSLTKLTLSKNITRIGDADWGGGSTFDACNKLSEIIWIGLTANPTVTFVSSCFNSIAPSGTICTNSTQYTSSQLLDWLQDKDGNYQNPKGGFPIFGWTAA